MIPQNVITNWSLAHPWPNADQVEQDLLLAQAICVIASDDLLGRELVIRGGTALHKLYLPRPFRYSEDLDYVRTTTGGIGAIMRRLTDMGKGLGYVVRTQMGQHPKVFWRYPTASGRRGKIKIEINTFERSPMLPLASRTLDVASPWCECRQDIPTFQAEELVATKLRALYQRSKGRDLFDLWLALTVLELEPASIVAAFPAYRPEGVTARLMRTNLDQKLADHEFRHDCDKLILGGAESCGYDALEAGALVDRALLSLL